jgi:hypothetical protein
MVLLYEILGWKVPLADKIPGPSRLLKDIYDKTYMQEDFNTCDGYIKLHDEIYTVLHDKKETIITVGGERSIVTSCWTATKKYFPDCILVYISPSYDCESVIKEGKRFSYSNYTIASLTGNCKYKYFDKQSVNKKSLSDIILLGMDKESDEDATFLESNEIDVYSDKIMKDKEKLIFEHLKSSFAGKPIHICLDVEVNRLSKYIKFIKEMIGNVVCLNIVNMQSSNCFFNVKEKNTIVELCDLFEKIGSLPKKSINIFNEDSPFLIFRSTDQKDPEVDYGWYILRGIGIELRESILELLKDKDTDEISFEEDGEIKDYLIAKTTINEQNKITYYGEKSISNFALFPDEKKNMMFELLNTTPIHD